MSLTQKLGKLAVFVQALVSNGDLNDPAYNRSVIEAIMRGERTATFRTLQEAVRKNKHLR